MAWDTWKEGTFAELETDEMGMQAQSMLKKVAKLAREVKVCAFIYILPSLPHCLSRHSPPLLSHFLHVHPFTLRPPSPSLYPSPSLRTRLTGRSLAVFVGGSRPSRRPCLSSRTSRTRPCDPGTGHNCRRRYRSPSTIRVRAKHDMLYTVHAQCNML